jgi:hypothetical protein
MRLIISVIIASLLLSTRFWAILPLVFASDLSVSATVPADTNDFQLEITSSGTSPLKAQTIYSYTITYGSYLANATNFSIVASWSQGTIEGLDSVTAVEYVPGSASKGEGNTIPIIDLTKNTITWEFDSFPAQATDKVLTFQLKTKSSSLTNQRINFSVSASLKGPGVTVNKSINQYLIFEGPSGSTTEPTSTPTPTQTPSSTPLKSLPKKLDFQVVDIRKLTANEATLFVQTNHASQIKLEYGEDLSFENIIYRNVYDTQHLLTLTNLKEQTKYYLRITIFDNKDEKKSEIYTFQTPEKTDLPTIEKNKIIIVSNNIILNNFSLPDIEVETKQKADQPKILLPLGMPYELQISLKNNKQIKKVEVFVRNDSVLGMSLFKKVDALSKIEADSTYGEMIQLSNGLSSVRLTAPKEKGIYGIFLRITDIYGNIIEEKIGNLIASPPIRIINSQDQKGIEGARAILSIYDEKRKKYTLITPSIISIPNPSYSDYKGEVNIVLPIAKYQLTVIHPDYLEKTILFEINNNLLEYPQIKLDKKPFSIPVIVSSYIATIQDTLLHPTQKYFDSLLLSKRLLDFTISLIIIIFIILSVFSFTKRIQISPLYLPLFILQILLAKTRHNGKSLNYLKGKIIDVDNDHALPQVNVYVFDAQKKVVTHTLTNSNGFFILKNIPDGHYTVAILKEGYEAFHLSTKIPSANPMIHITITKQTPPKTKIEKIKRMFAYYLSLTFEVLIVVTFVLIILGGFKWGLPNILPYLLLNSINLGLWIIYQKNKTHNIF